MKTGMQRVMLVLGLMSALLLLGTLGFHLVEHWSLFESFYMTVMTLTTVGFGEVHPLSYHGRIVASALMLAGVIAVFISIGVLVDLMMAAGKMLFNPDGATQLESGDVLIAIGERSALKRIGEELDLRITES